MKLHALCSFQEFGSIIHETAGILNDLGQEKKDKRQRPLGDIIFGRKAIGEH
jgi:hypothetical protein